MTNILWFPDQSVAAGPRAEMPAGALNRIGITAKMVRDITPDFKPDVLVLQRPLTYNVADILAQAHAEKIRVVVDLDDDFRAIPAAHPGYRVCGPGSSEAMERLTMSLAACDHLIVATEELATRYADCGKPITVIPNGWDCMNPVYKRRPKRDPNKVYIGWAGSTTHRDDLRQVIQPLIRIAQERPEVVIVIGADIEFYRQLSKLPERQRMFLPGVSFNEYPYLLMHFDLLVVPLLRTEFNLAKSDIKLVEAGVLRLPWLASRMPQYTAWGAGGELVDSDWYGSIRTMLNSAKLWAEIGEQGYQKAQEREIGRLVDLWKGAILG